MKPFLLIPFLLLSSLAARENPFFPASDLQNVTSNVSDAKPSLSPISYPIPDQARILQEVTVTFQNVDGTIESRVIEIDKSIDWRKPLVLSQGNISSSPRTETSKNASAADFGFIRFDTKGKWMTIKTDVPPMRHFVLSEPNRIVIDFKPSRIFKNDKAFFNASPFVSVAVANHGKFGRATITLDGRYECTLKQTGDTIVVMCR